MVPPSRHARGSAAALLVAGLVVTSGCNGFGNDRYDQLERSLIEKEEQIRSLELKLADQRDTIRGLQEQVMELRHLEGDPLDVLVYPVKIELERLSGGYDDDGKTGDDGIILYVRPIDRDGHVVKAAGSLEVALYDLADSDSPDRRLIAKYDFDEATIRSLWFGRMWTHHFTVRCPWPASGPPEHDEITADAVFTDRMSGQKLRAQELFKVMLPLVPATGPSE